MDTVLQALGAQIGGLTVSLAVKEQQVIELQQQVEELQAQLTEPTEKKED